MEWIAVLLVAAVVFGLCFCIDKAFTGLFRSRAQHTTGLAVRLNRKLCAFGLILCMLALAAIFAGLKEGWVLIAGGVLLLVVGVGLIVYYITFGIFYDDDSFLYTTFGKKSVTYRYNQIRGQQLYVVQGGNIIVELHMTDGSAVSVQLQMQGAEDFLNTAFLGWVRQKNLDARNGFEFHDPDNSCWFPGVEEN